MRSTMNLNNPDLNQFLQQAELMKENMKRIEDQLQKMEVKGQSKSGLVEISMTGKHQVKSFSLKPILLDEDKEMIEADIVEALNDVLKKIETVMREQAGHLTSGIQLPDEFK